LVTDADLCADDVAAQAFFLRQRQISLASSVRGKTCDFDCRADERCGTMRLSSDFPWQAAHRIKTTEQNVARKSGLRAVFEINVNGPDSVNMDVRRLKAMTFP